MYAPVWTNISLLAERCESFNASVRAQNVYGNHKSPSWDIAINFTHLQYILNITHGTNRDAKERRGKLQQSVARLISSCQQTRASTSAEQESCSSTKVTTLDANQQISSTEPLCEGGNEEHIGVTEKIEVTESPDDLNSEGLLQEYNVLFYTEAIIKVKDTHPDLIQVPKCYVICEIL
ncbi:hypothetical protein EMCRGX_G026577 [Ephydatia muelleri]